MPDNLKATSGSKHRESLGICILEAAERWEFMQGAEAVEKRSIFPARLAVIFVQQCLHE